MPYEIQASPGGHGYYVITKGSRRAHSEKPLTKSMAARQMAALYARVPDSRRKR
jgi:predicted site-specific integrase-resolvase